MPILLKSKKEYVALAYLHKDVPKDKIRKVCRQFIGKIKQLPPKKSAVARRIRERKIYSLKILEISGRFILMKVKCQAGTYIRRLCITPDTNIILANGGSTTIGDFVDNCDNKVHTIQALNLDSQKIEKCNIKAVHKLPAPKKMIHLKTESGITIKLTPDHEVLVDSTKGPKWVSASKLKKNDFIYSPRKIEVKEELPYIVDMIDNNFMVVLNETQLKYVKNIVLKKFGSIRAMNRKKKLDRRILRGKQGIRIKYLKSLLSKEWQNFKKDIKKFKTEKGFIIELKSSQLNRNFMYILGLILSDGNVMFERGCTRPNRIKFSNKTDILIRLFIEKHKNLFSKIPIHSNQKNGKTELDIHNSLLASIAYSLGIKSPNIEKSDIAPILTLPKDLISQLLKGYFDGDGGGHIKKQKGKKSHHSRISFFSSNTTNLKRVYQLLKILGIRSKIYLSDSKGGFKTVHKKYRLDIITPYDKLQFIKMIGTSDTTKLNKIKNIKKIFKRYTEKNSFDIMPQITRTIIRDILKYHNIRPYKLDCGTSGYRILSGKSLIRRHTLKRILTKLKKIVKDKRITKLEQICFSDYYLEKIKSVKIVKSDSKYVYDITVDKLHNFMPEGVMVVSNCDDIGKKLKTGAHLQELRRISSGSFTEDQCVTMQDLIDAVAFYNISDLSKDKLQKEQRSQKIRESKLREIIHPLEIVANTMKNIVVKDSAILNIVRGAPVYSSGLVRVQKYINKGDVVGIFSLKGEMIGFGDALMTSKEMLRGKKKVVKTDRILVKNYT